MAGANGSSPRPYRVIASPLAREQFLTLVRRGQYTGTDGRIIEAMKRLNRRLERDPLELGEPMYTLRAAKLRIRRAAVAPLYVEYGVHEDRPVVIVRHVAALTDPIE